MFSRGCLANANKNYSTDCDNYSSSSSLSAEDDTRRRLPNLVSILRSVFNRKSRSIVGMAGRQASRSCGNLDESVRFFMRAAEHTRLIASTGRTRTRVTEDERAAEDYDLPFRNLMSVLETLRCTEFDEETHCLRRIRSARYLSIPDLPSIDRRTTQMRELRKISRNM